MRGLERGERRCAHRKMRADGRCRAYEPLRQRGGRVLADKNTAADQRCSSSARELLISSGIWSSGMRLGAVSVPAASAVS